MSKNPISILPLLVLMVVLAASACVPGALVSNQQDDSDLAGQIDLVRTQAALTVVAEITSNALLNPTSAITETPLSTPTLTQTGVSETSPFPSFTPVTATTAAPVIVVPAGPTQTPTSSKWGCVVVGKMPSDGEILGPYGDFDAVWFVENTGTEAWDKAYVDYVYYGGDEMSKGDDRYDLQKSVPPGDEMKVIADMTAPAYEGDYVTTWALVLGSDPICTFSISIRVVDSS